MDEDSKRTARDLFIRICRDSGFKMEWSQASSLAAGIMGVHPMEVAFAFPYLHVLDEIAKGEHQVCSKV